MKVPTPSSKAQLLQHHPFAPSSPVLTTDDVSLPILDIPTINEKVACTPTFGESTFATDLAHLQDQKKSSRTRLDKPYSSSIISVSPSTPSCFSGFQSSFTLFNLLLLFIPLSIIFQYTGVPSPVIFISVCIAIVPLAGLMGDATEIIAVHFGAGIGGLLNATFGNAAELILSLAAAYKGLDTLVKSSLCGSIIGNILLVLGASILAGGIKYKTQHFSLEIANSESTMAVAAAVAFLIPTIYHTVTAPASNTTDSTAVTTTNNERGVSLGICTLLIFTYAMMLFFQLRTHAEYFNEQADKDYSDIEENKDKKLEDKGESKDDKQSNRTEVFKSRITQLKEQSSPSTRKASIISLLSNQAGIPSPAYKKIYARLAVAEAKRADNKQQQQQSINTTTTVIPLPEHQQLIEGEVQRVVDVKAAIRARSYSETSTLQTPANNQFGYSIIEEPPVNIIEEPHPLQVSSSPLVVITCTAPSTPNNISKRISLAPIEHGPQSNRIDNSSISLASDEASVWSVRTAVVILAVSCGLVAFLSEILTDVVVAAGESLGLSETFLGIIVVAIIGNAAEHTTAVSAALNNNLNVSISIAFGSALQIALFVIPVVIFASYGRSSEYGGGMDLRVSELEVFGVSVSVVLAWMVVHDGGTNWLEGLMLLMIYFILAIAFFYVT